MRSHCCAASSRMPHLSATGKATLCNRRLRRHSLLTGLLGSLALRFDPTLPAMIAPMGASAVLLFAVPSSPLAQPWSILCGNLVSRLLVGERGPARSGSISCQRARNQPCDRCHDGAAVPASPSGAVALTAVLGGPAVHSLGYGFLLCPLPETRSSFSLLRSSITTRPARLSAWSQAWQSGARHHDPTPFRKSAFLNRSDEVLKEYDEVLDIDRDALETILPRLNCAPTTAAARCISIVRASCHGMSSASHPMTAFATPRD